MGRFEGGWIKAWRKVAGSDLVDNIYVWGLWHWLLYSAVWKPTKVLWNGKQREIPPGTVVFGLKELADRWDCSRATVSRWLKYLDDTGRINYESCTHGCIVSICNWELYQSKEDDEFTPTERELNADCTRTEREVALSEEVKKLRTEENKEKDLKFSLSEENKNRAFTAWENLLIHFKMGREILESEKRPLLQAVQRHGINALEMAFRGAATERKTDTFDPSDFVKLHRYLEAKNFERFLNLGVKAWHKDKAAS